jgi:hypothetical protein
MFERLFSLLCGDISHEGSALPVMRSLRRSSRQVVVATEPLEGANVMGELLGA